MANGSTGWGTPPNASSGWGAPPPPNPSINAAWGNLSNANAAGQASGGNFYAEATPRPETRDPKGLPGLSGLSLSVDDLPEGSPVKMAPMTPMAPMAPASPPSQPQLSSTSWAAAAGKGLPASDGTPGASASEPSAKQLEQLNSVREALFSTDGWGSNFVKQDVPWHVDGMEAASKEPVHWEAGEAPRPVPSRNDGTELWKSTLSGQPMATKPSPATQWHKPQNPADYRTWGEEEEPSASFGAVGGNGVSSNGVGTIGSRDSSMWNSSQGPAASSSLNREISDQQKTAPGWNSDRSRDPSGSRGFSETLESSNWNQPAAPRNSNNNWGAPSQGHNSRANDWGDVSPINRQGTANGGTMNWSKQPQTQNQQAWKEMPRGPNSRPSQWNNPRGSGWNDQNDGNMWQDISEKPEPNRWGEPGWSNGARQRPIARTSPGWDDIPPQEVGGWRADAPKKVFNPDSIRTTKQFKVLMDMGWHADEAEFALRSCHGVLEDAIEMLNMGRLREPNPIFPGAQNSAVFDQTRSYQPGGPAMYQQPDSGYGFKGGISSSHVRPASSVKLSQGNDELKFIVSQIQMAVQAGYLNPRILNQPLSPNTLNCLNKLLYEIKSLNALQQQHTQASITGGNLVTINVSIVKARQAIVGLQNQINYYQSNYTPKTPQQQPQVQSSYEPPMADFYGFGQQSNQPSLDPMVSSINGSRLGRWMLPDNPEQKSQTGAIGSNLKTGLGLEDNTWTPQVGGTSWPESSKQQASAMPTDSGSSALDVYSIPEFVPGKLWSGIGIKNPDDDPSLTPASAAQIDMNSLGKNENPKVSDSSNQSATVMSKGWQNGSSSGADHEALGPNSMFSSPSSIWSTSSAQQNDSQPRPTSFLPEGLLSDSM